MRVVAEGKAHVAKKGEVLTVEQGTFHSIEVDERAFFFTLDIPGFYYPEDVYEDAPTEKIPFTPPESQQTPIDPAYFQKKFDMGDCVAYSIFPGDAVDGAYSVALLEISDSPRHFHKVEEEIFVVVEGALDIEVDGEHSLLQVGECVKLIPNQVHHLKLAHSDPVRVISFNFPAFDPKDMYLVKDD